jgi:hypothetical protein
MGRSSLRYFSTAAVLAGVGAGCAGLVDESGRPCPCAADSVCCVDVCVPAAEGCGDSSGDGAANTADTGAEAGLDAPGAPDAPGPDALDARDASDALLLDTGNASDATGAFDAPAPDSASTEASGPDAAVCMSLPRPLVHFAFSDCSAGSVRDTAGGATGVFEGSGILCDQSPVGGALRFDGVADAMAGSYVRVFDALDAGPPVCSTNAECPPGWPFASAITVSALLDVASTSSYENILGQWYYADSYIFNTYYDTMRAAQVLRFTVQPAGGAPPVDLIYQVPLPSGPSLHAWSHWVGVYDGVSARLYEDGRQVAMAPMTSDASASLQCTTEPLELGAIGMNVPCANLDSNYFTGAIGDVQIFNVALDPDQVQALECSLGWPTATSDAGM